MLHKFWHSKIFKGIGCVVLTVAIYYFMTDGFTRTIGEVAKVGKDAAAEADSAGGFADEWLVIGILAVWMLALLVKYLWEKHGRRPKNDVNIRY